MEFKIIKSDNQSFLRIKLPVQYKELATVRKLVDLTVRDEDGKTVFTVHEAPSVSVSPQGIAFPMPRLAQEINISAQLDDADETSMKYYVALIKKGITAYLENFEKAQKEITELTKDVEVE